MRHIVTIAVAGKHIFRQRACLHTWFCVCVCVRVCVCGQQIFSSRCDHYQLVALPSFLTYYLFRTFNPAMQGLSLAMPHSDFLAWLSSATLKIFILGVSSRILMP